MIKILLGKPISVLVFFLTCVILGFIAYKRLPVSLLPDIPIPQITIQLQKDGSSARELENTAVRPIRQYLQQLSGLRDIRSESQNGFAFIRLNFDHGSNTDLAFIEVNEKIDLAMNSLPRDMLRPRVVKASASDLPVFYLNLSLKSDIQYAPTNEKKFLELSGLAESVVKRHIEQLPEVALADITGLMHKHIQIMLKENANTSLISTEDIENALNSNNIETENMSVVDGSYLYDVKLTSHIRTVEDIWNILFEKDGKIIRFGDIADVKVTPQNDIGRSLVNGKRAITIGIIKQSEETIENLKLAVDKVLVNLKSNHDEIEFTLNRNQTELLDYTISNLENDLIAGFILVSIVALIFLGNFKSPFVIAVCTVSAFLTTFIVFLLFKQSLNIITVSGLILALGNMIDSSIVVTDIIAQYRNEGYSLEDSCEKGTKEVIVPILSSTLTTISVFIPLVFMSGIAGAIFFSEAFAVTVGMIISYFTGIILLPVVYKMLYKHEFPDNFISNKLTQLHLRLDNIIFPIYDKGIEVVFRNKKKCISILILSIPLCVLLFVLMPKSMMPKLDHVETLMKIDWNENISIDENNARTFQLLKNGAIQVVEHSAYLGHQQYLLERNNELSENETEIYIKARTSLQLSSLEKNAFQWLKSHYPEAAIAFSPPDNVFQRIFDKEGADIILELTSKYQENTPKVEEIRHLEAALPSITGRNAEPISFDQQYELILKNEQLLLYGVTQHDIYTSLKTALQDNQIAVLRSFQQYLPIVISGKQQSIDKLLSETHVRSGYFSNGKLDLIPVRTLIELKVTEDLKMIVAGKAGEHIPFKYDNINQPEKFMESVKAKFGGSSLFNLRFTGDYFYNKLMINELSVVLFISIFLMYLILVAQFQSFLQPLILLMEIPIDIAFALGVLWATGNSLNLMSAIGIIVVIGVIVNDSVLKIDLINELRASNKSHSLRHIIHIAGVRRLRAIIMTSLTSILAMVPIIFAFDLGSELQKPLAIAMISTMSIGTVVSIFLIPLLYWLTYNRKTNYAIENHE